MAQWRIGEWIVEPELNRISAGVRKAVLEPRMMAVLVRLSEARGRPVTKRQLFASVWRDQAVSESVLKHVIWELRRALGDDARSPSYIETLPRIGYRMVAEVARLDTGTAPAPPRPVSGPGHSRLIGPAGAAFLAILALAAALAGFFTVNSVHGPARAGPGPGSPPLSRPLTALPGLEIDPSFSPDGRSVVFSRRSGRSGFDLFVQEIGQSSPARLTGEPGDELAPRWSPDGRRIAFIHRTPSGSRRLGVIRLAEEEIRHLTVPPGEPVSVTWGAAGRSLVVSAREGPESPAGLYAMSLPGGSIRRLTTPPPGTGGDTSSRVSPDGRWIAFQRSWDRWSGDLFIIPFQGGAPRRLTRDHAQVAGFTWSADGRRVILSSDRVPPRGLWVVTPGGGPPAYLPVPLGGPQGPAASPEQRLLAVEEVTCDSNIWVLDRAEAGSRPDPLVASTRMDYHPQLSPDGRRIAFISRRSGHREAWVARTDGGNPRQVSRLRGPHLITVNWSPEGRRLLLGAREDGRSAVHIVEAHGGRGTRLKGTPRRALSPVWAGDGGSVYYGSDRDGTWQIWRHPLDGSSPVRVTGSGGFVAREDPDGRWLYYLKPDRADLWRRPVRGGPESVAVPQARISDAISWGVSRSGIVFLRSRETGGAELAFHDLGTIETTPILPVSRPSPYPGLHVSPDGRRILYAQVDRFESDIHLVEPGHLPEPRAAGLSADALR